MTRVVFDTNIYISALHFHSSVPRRLLNLAEQSVFQLVISKQIISELRGVLRVKFGYDTINLDLLEELLLANCLLVEPKRRIKFIKADPDDDRILECAFEGRTDYIISGDSHLLKIGKYRSIKIFTPREFLEKLSSD